MDPQGGQTANPPPSPRPRRSLPPWLPFHLGVVPWVWSPGCGPLGVVVDN